MEIIEAKHLRDLWQGKPCDHPKWTAETINGKDTGDEVCTQCGQTRLAGRYWQNDGDKDSDRSRRRS